jgi:hypothetical protein
MGRQRDIGTLTVFGCQSSQQVTCKPQRLPRQKENKSTLTLAVDGSAHRLSCLESRADKVYQSGRIVLQFPGTMHSSFLWIHQ